MPDVSYVLIHELRDTRGRLRADIGSAVQIRPASTPGMIHITCDGFMKFESLVPASWVRIKVRK